MRWLPLRTLTGFLPNLLLLLSLSLVACGDDSTGPAGIEYLLITPDLATLDAGETLHLSVQVKTADGRMVVRRVSWRSADPLVAEVDKKGRVTGISDGWATVYASLRGVEAQATIRVVGPGGYNCAHQADLSQPECWALVALYEGTGGEDWRDASGWLANAKPCGWKGITCAGGSVKRLQVGYNDLVGPIPPEMRYLSDLEVLGLGSNQLTGLIPPELMSLSALTFLDLNANDLIGQLPPELGTLENLTHLIIGLNQFTGPIPAELGDLSNLEQLSLFGNQLTGSIPPELGNLSELAYLELDRNQLTGPIPAELGGLTHLERLGLYENQLTGSIPPELGALWFLERFLLHSNQLTGPIPAELGALPNLQWMWLTGNQLSGEIPLPVVELGGRLQAELGEIRCSFIPPGNEGLLLPAGEEYRDADEDGDGFICGLGFSAVQAGG